MHAPHNRRLDPRTLGQRGELSGDPGLFPDAPKVAGSNPHGANPHGPTLQGIDVASPQGHALDWSLVAADGIRFAWMQTDATFARNWREARAKGVLRGAYQFFRPEVNAIVQADKFLLTMGALAADDLHPMLDVEVSHGMTAAQVIDGTARWVEHVEDRTGRPVVLYTYPSYWRDTLGQPLHSIGKRGLWIAHYVVDPVSGKVYNLRAPIVPRTWSSWLLWQTSGNKGPRVPGIPFDIDRDVFWGDEATFRDVFTLAGIAHADTDPIPPPLDSSEPTWPGTPTSKSQDRMRAVREHLADLSEGSAATPLRADEAKHTPLHLRSDDHE